MPSSPQSMVVCDSIYFRMTLYSVSVVLLHSSFQIPPSQSSIQHVGASFLAKAGIWENGVVCKSSSQRPA
jgi:hypothetical protein